MMISLTSGKMNTKQTIIFNSFLENRKNVSQVNNYIKKVVEMHPENYYEDQEDSNT